MTRVVSTLPGRVRVRDKALRNPALCARVEAQLRQIEGLAVMQPNPSVGSIVLHFAAGDIDPLELERKIDAIIDAAIATPRPSGARPLRLQDTDTLLGRPVDDELLAALGKLVARQASPMRSTVTAAHHRRLVAAATAQRLLRELAQAGPP